MVEITYANGPSESRNGSGGSIITARGDLQEWRPETYWLAGATVRGFPAGHMTVKKANVLRVRLL